MRDQNLSLNKIIGVQVGIIITQTDEVVMLNHFVAFGMRFFIGTKFDLRMEYKNKKLQ